eukprot:1181080-Prorocentrum_minimum.AAC.2
MYGNGNGYGKSSLTLRGLLPGTPRRGYRLPGARFARTDGPEIRPGVGARPGNVKDEGTENPMDVMDVI